MNIKQWVAILIAILSVLAVSTANLTDILGPQMAKVISSAANMLNAMLAGILSALTSQTATVKEVLAMPGIESVKVNADAGQTLAKIAVDPAQEKIEPTAQDRYKVASTAVGETH